MEQENLITASIAAQLRASIAEQNVLKKDLAERSGLSLVTLSRYLNGHRDIPVPAFMAICSLLGVDAGSIVNQAAKQL